METEVYASISLCFLYNPKLPASRFLGFSTCFHAVFCSAYSTQKMEPICSSETSVDFQRTARRYIPEDNTLHTRNIYRYLNSGGSDIHGYSSILMTENLFDRIISQKKKHNRSLKVAVQGLDFMTHPLYIHISKNVLKIDAQYAAIGFGTLRYFRSTETH
jgi:hypothetical protein